MEGTIDFRRDRCVDWDRLNSILQLLIKQIETNTMRDLDIKSYVIKDILYIPHFNWKVNLQTMNIEKVDIVEIYKAFKEKHETISIPYQYTYIINHFLETQKEYQKEIEIIREIVKTNQQARN